MKIIPLLLGGGVVAWGLSRLSRLQNFAKEFTFTVSASFQNLSSAGVDLVFNVTVKNPTAAQVTLGHPSISVFGSEADATNNPQSPLKASVPENKSYVIQKNTETVVGPIVVKLTAIDLLPGGIGFNLLSKIYFAAIQGKSSTVAVRTTITANGIRQKAAIKVVSIPAVRLRKTV